MSSDYEPEEINIKANNIDAAARKIIPVLEDTSKGNVLYFHGWDGLGASAAHRLVAQRLKSSTGFNKFDKVVYVDCSVWKSRRALQKVVAKELELPRSVMAIFDRCDEDDDFNGVDEGSRKEVAEVSRHIFRSLAYSTFLVIFENGSNGYVDLSEFGIPLYPHLSNKMLWTFGGRSRNHLLAADDAKEVQKLLGNTSVFLHCDFTVEGDELGSAMWGILHEAAKDVAERIGMPEYINHKIVEECFMYMLPPQKMKGIDWETHAFNYWVCDGILQGDTSAWEISDAMQSYMHLDWNFHEEWTDEASFSTTRHLHRDVPWQLPICCSSSSDISNVPPEATSFFAADTILLVSMFQHPGSSMSLRVLHASFCKFSFASPPFLCCSNLRFLLLDSCEDKDDLTNVVHEEHGSHSQSELQRACFRRLWVLDLRYTHWYQLLSEEIISFMANLRELNVKGVKQKGKRWRITDFCGRGTNLVKLRVVVGSIPAEDEETNNQVPFPNMSSENSLKTIVLDGCVDLEKVIPDTLPPLLESFSFINKAATTAKISSISFQGCSQLKSILLRGFLGSLEELDLSGTAIKTLDLREVQAPNLKRLILLGCEKLCAILWPPENRTDVKVLHINTIRSASPSERNREESTKEASAATRSLSIHNVATTQQGIGQTASFDFNWYISVRDARLLRSLLPVKGESVRMEMDSSPASSIAGGDSEVAQGIGSMKQPDKYLYARDAIFLGHLRATGNEGAISWMWDCPTSPTPTGQDWYVHTQDEVEMKSRLLHQPGPGSTEETISSAALVPAFVCDNARMMHVHDSLAITCIPCQQSSTWYCLKWCRVERCPKIRSVFATPQEIHNTSIFWSLATLWVSQLPVACYIWNWSAIFQPSRYSFRGLVFLHLDYCPRLIHVLPFSEHVTTLPSLETLEIVCCGDLREVFPLDPKHQEEPQIIEFPNLRRMHLYELPMLQHICGSKMSAPKLETVKIRGCWSLRRLPAVKGNTTKRPKVDCEKDWWGNLEWDGLAANHHPSHYDLTHSMYYKKAQLPRGPLLR